jgi:sugar phosphate isomerase/epimerase
MTPTLSRRALLALATATAGGTILAPFGYAASGQPFFQRVKLPIGLELYTVAKEASEDLDGTFARVAAIGYKEVEVSSYYGHNAAQIRAACDRHGLVCRTMHAQGQATRAPEDASFTDLPKVVDDAKTLGAQYVVLPMLPLRLDFKNRTMTMQTFMDAVRSITEDDWKACAEMLNDKGEQLARAGLKIGYHNHNIEFAPIGNTTPYEILMKATNPSLVHFELDVGWVASAGLDPIALLNQYKGRFRLLHVKDLKASTKPNYTIQMDPADIGAGTLDWAKLLPTAYDAGVRHFLVEQEPPYPAGGVIAAQNGYRYLSQLQA